MSTWCEIVRYRANMKAVFTPDTTKNELEEKNSSTSVEKRARQKLLLRCSNFARPTVQ